MSNAEANRIGFCRWGERIASRHPWCWADLRQPVGDARDTAAAILLDVPFGNIADRHDTAIAVGDGVPERRSASYTPCA